MLIFLNNTINMSRNLKGKTLPSPPKTLRVTFMPGTDQDHQDSPVLI